ncbi:MAG: sulfatase [Candidatus Hydrogenedentota bacterium]
MTRLTRRKLLGTLAAGGLAASLPAQARPRVGPVKPNFILIVCDDLGYGDLGCYGAVDIPTPHIDRMANEGMRFTQVYACAAMCTPSRAGLLTGRYPIRSGLTQPLFPNSVYGITPAEPTIGTELQRAGYVTACIGKWHLGSRVANLPTANGFDYFFGLPYSHDMNWRGLRPYPAPLMSGTEIIEQPTDISLLTRRYTEESVAFIQENTGRPFLLYLPHSMPHTPPAVSEPFVGVSNRGPYGDAVAELDWSTGEILLELRNQGIDERTLVIFTSDHGPARGAAGAGGSTGGLRGGKGTTFEGGVRVPFILRWPNFVAKGSVQTRPASLLDLLPTFLTLTGQAGPEDRIIDGKDLSLVIKGEGRRADEEFFFCDGRHVQSYRSGPWKLTRRHTELPPTGPQRPARLLFNIEEDPFERVNLAARYPRKVEQMALRLALFEARVRNGLT